MPLPVPVFSKRPGRLGGRLVDLSVAIWLVAVGVRMTWGLERGLDIGLYDETLYLAWGATLGPGHMPSPAWAPLYCAWYKSLSVLQPDRVALYYLNFATLAILTPVAFYLLLRTCGLAVWMAAAIATFFLASDGNMIVWPRVSHFALCVLFTTLAASRVVRSRARSVCILCIGALLASYVRPEFYLSFLLLAGVYLAGLLWKRPPRRFRRHIGCLVSLAAIVTLLHLVFGFPLGSEGGGEDRGFIAFGQHFAANWVRWHASDLNPFTDWREIVSASFDGARSVTAAALYNPAAFVAHLVSNAAHYALYLVLVVAYLPFPQTIFRLHPWGDVPVVLLAVGAVFLARNKEGPFCSALGTRIRRFDTLAIGLAAILLPSALSCVVIAPKWHVLFLQFPLVVLCIVVFVLKPFSSPSRIHPDLWIAVAALALLLAPGSTRYFQDDKRENLKTIRFLQSLGFVEKPTILEAQGELHLYVDNSFRRVEEFAKDGPFLSFLESRGIDAVIDSPELSSDSRFRSDPEWGAFLKEYESLGFERIDVPGTRRVLYVRKGLVRSSEESEGR